MDLTGGKSTCICDIATQHSYDIGLIEWKVLLYCFKAWETSLVINNIFGLVFKAFSIFLYSVKCYKTSYCVVEIFSAIMNPDHTTGDIDYVYGHFL